MSVAPVGWSMDDASSVGLGATDGAVDGPLLAVEGDAPALVQAATTRTRADIDRRGAVRRDRFGMAAGRYNDDRGSGRA
jgi:hypothetical protein